MNIDYEAAVKAWGKGSPEGFEQTIHNIIDAALGDTVLYKKVYRQPTLADIETIKFVQVWPKGDNE